MTMKHRKLTVEDLMSTALVTTRPGESVAEADFEMKLASVRHIPVVDDRNRLVGIVSQRDILRAMGRSESGSILIRNVMTTQIRTVRPSTLAAEAARLMLQHKIGSLPVLGDDDQLVGLVTESDFVRLARQLLLEPAAVRRTREAG